MGIIIRTLDIADQTPIDIKHIGIISLIT